MEAEYVIQNLFCDVLNHDDKIEALAKLERENSPLLDELVKKYHPEFWLENYISVVPEGYEFPGYEKHIMNFNLIIALEKYKKDSSYNPKLDNFIDRGFIN